MQKKKVDAIKARFYALLGSLSVEEIMSNPCLMQQARTIARMLVSLTS